MIVGVETIIAEHEAGFWTELSPAGRKHIVVEDFVREWRKRIGDIGRAKIEFLYKEGDLPFDMEFDLGHPDPAILPWRWHSSNKNWRATPVYMTLWITADPASQSSPSRET